MRTRSDSRIRVEYENRCRYSRSSVRRNIRGLGRHIGAAIERRDMEGLCRTGGGGAVGIGQLCLQYCETRLGLRVARGGGDGIPFIRVDQALRHAVAALIQHREIE